MNTPELIETINDRMLAYAFLSRAYRTAPDAAFLDSLATTASAEGNPLSQFCAELEKGDKEKIRVELAAEYNSLLLNMSAEPVSPFESVHTSDEGLMMQEARDEVLALYRAENLSLTEGLNIPEDHISIELDFMVHLCEKTLSALKENNTTLAQSYLEKQKSFLENHLLNWVPSFCAALLKRSKTDFYQGVATMTLDHLKADQAWLEEVCA